MRWWFRDLMRLSLACLLRCHGPCTGTTYSRTDVTAKGMCPCRCHYRITRP